SACKVVSPANSFSPASVTLPSARDRPNAVVGAGSFASTPAFQVTNQNAGRSPARPSFAGRQPISSPASPRSQPTGAPASSQAATRSSGSGLGGSFLAGGSAAPASPPDASRASTATAPRQLTQRGCTSRLLG